MAVKDQSFVIIATSNSKQYPTNRPSNFYFDLPEEIDLTGYEVGVSKIRYSPTQKNLLNEKISFTLENMKLNLDEITHKVVTKSELTKEEFKNTLFPGGIVNSVEMGSPQRGGKLFRFDFSTEFVTPEGKMEVLRYSCKNCNDTDLYMVVDAYKLGGMVIMKESRGGLKPADITKLEETYGRFRSLNLFKTSVNSLHSEKYLLKANTTLSIDFKLMDEMYVSTDKKKIKKIEPGKGIIFSFAYPIRADIAKRNFVIQPGPAYCENIDELVSLMNRKMTELGESLLKLEYDNMKRVIQVKENRANIEGLSITEINMTDIGEILGFHGINKIYRGVMTSSTILEASSPPNMTRGVTGLFLYSNFVDYSILTDRRVPILCEFGMPGGKYGSVCEVFIQDPLYIPTANGRVRQMYISVYDNVGEEAKFLSQGFALTMKFRKKQF